MAKYKSLVSTLFIYNKTSEVPVEHETLKSGRDVTGRDGTTDDGRTTTLEGQTWRLKYLCRYHNHRWLLTVATKFRSFLWSFKSLDSTFFFLGWGWFLFGLHAILCFAALWSSICKCCLEMILWVSLLFGLLKTFWLESTLDLPGSNFSLWVTLYLLAQKSDKVSCGDVFTKSSSFKSSSSSVSSVSDLKICLMKNMIRFQIWITSFSEVLTRVPGESVMEDDCWRQWDS